ncbi:flagellar hook-associated protein FlgK [Stratiformator vulcanicus]|uniref:Flagellar hook-associated protein 1 n=1 Tax=Stratiformator vulcanicus TaxID=2527980 RepID=A0A517R3W7_9PLAN|nr:flagellar hook-associated protein FlgK [Stratiformator vulcanicus]QDT38582.1 Flagellar hook-associated protein 1 [Stratiformator vulcanicus]
MSLNSSLHVAGRSLEVFSAGLSVAGQNIANANTPGYVREELKINANTPFKVGQHIFGTGVYVEGIQQQIDLFLETRIHTANGDLAHAEARSDIFLALETTLNELGDSDLSTALSDFSSALNNLANEPDDLTLRSLVVQQGEELARDVTDLRLRIDELRSQQSLNLDNLVQEANELIDEIDRLNPQIARLEASGLLQSDAGALRTQRYQALERLSEIVPVRFQERSDGGVDVFSGSNWLVLGGSTQHLETFKTADRGISITSVQYATTQQVLSEGAGEIRGIIDGRDEILGSFVDDLDTLTTNLIGAFNEVYTSGEGLAGHTSLTGQTEVADPTLALNAAGLSFTPRHGSFEVKLVNLGTGAIETTEITVDLDGIGGANTTLNDLQAALDGIINLSATVDPLGRLQLSTTDGYEVRFANDSSGTLASLGINTFFTGTDSGDFGINANVKADPNLLATGRGGGPGDNKNIVALQTFLEDDQIDLGGQSLRGFYELTVAEVAQQSAAASSLRSGSDAFVASLQSQKQQFSGVSLDQETIKMLEFQRAYQSAARLISTIDELYDVLLNV